MEEGHPAEGHHPALLRPEGANQGGTSITKKTPRGEKKNKSFWGGANSKHS